MTNKQRLLAGLRGQPVDRYPWHGDVSYWLAANAARGTVPEKYRGMNHYQVGAALGMELNYGFLPYKTVSPAFYILEPARSVAIEQREERQGDFLLGVIRTPWGELTYKDQLSSDWTHTRYRVEFPLKRREDFEIAARVCAASAPEPADGFAALEEKVGDAGITMSSVPRSPFSRLLLEFLGPENAYLALHDSPKEVAHLLRVMDETGDALFEIVAGGGPTLVNFPDNMDCHLYPPPIYEKYLIPYYRKRTAQLHRTGKLCQCHVDGNMKTLLPLFKETGLDVLEAITPQPMGDVSLAEVIDALEGKLCLWGGLPSSIFCFGHSDDEFADLVRGYLRDADKAKGFVVGIGDQAPPESEVTRLEMVAGLIAEHAASAAR